MTQLTILTFYVSIYEPFLYFRHCVFLPFYQVSLFFLFILVSLLPPRLLFFLLPGNKSRGYDLSTLVTSTWVVYGFAVMAPVTIWLVLNQLNISVTLIKASTRKTPSHGNPGYDLKPSDAVHRLELLVCMERRCHGGWSLIAALLHGGRGCLVSVVGECNFRLLHSDFFRQSETFDFRKMAIQAL